MKKHSNFKILSIFILSLVVLSWIIPGGQFNGAEVVKSGMARVGIFDLINFPLSAAQFFIQLIMFILVVGGFYGVLSKTGKYSSLVDKIAKKLKGKEIIFLILVAFLTAALSSVFGFGIVLFIFIPFIISIILALGFDKMVALLIAVLPILIGIIGATFNVPVVGYLNTLMGTTFNTEIITKISLFVITFVVYILFTIKYAVKVKKSKKNSVIETENEDLFLSEKSKTKKSVLPIAIVLLLLFVVVFMGCSPWNDMFNISCFGTFHTWLTTKVLIGKFAIFGAILGKISELGKWHYSEVTMMVLIATLIISLLYKIKLDDVIDGFAEGAKKVFKIAFLMAFAMIVVIICAYHPFYSMIIDWILGLTDKFNIFTAALSTMIGSVLNIEMVYLAQSTIPVISSMFTSSRDLIILVFQAIYGLTMFVAPTSLVLIMGLEYLDISYKTWIKFSWKLLLQLLVVILAILIIVTLI